MGSDSFIRSLIAGYKVEVYDSSDVLLRTSFVTSNEYVYSYATNLSDSTTGIPEGDLTFVIRTIMVNSKESNNGTVFTTSNGNPIAITGLTGITWMEAAKFTWVPNTEPDFSHYSIRTKVGLDSWSSWFNFASSEYFRSLTDTEVTTYTSIVAVYFEIKAIDVFSNESVTSSTNVTTSGLDIQSSDIDDFAITASKIYTKIPIITGDSWTNDSPTSGYVTWNEHTLVYDGATYTIQTGSTNQKYIYWINGSSFYLYSNTHPSSFLTDGDFIIAVNVNGTHDLAWNSIANQVIGSAYIQDLAVQDAHIGNISADKIDTGTLTGIQIIGNTFATAFSGKRIIITSDGITLHVTSSVGKYSTFKYGDGTLYGSGAVGYIHHVSQTVPFYVSAEQTVGDFHYYNRSATPTGPAQVGDTAVRQSKLLICTSPGTPGTWVVVGSQN